MIYLVKVNLHTVLETPWLQEANYRFQMELERAKPYDEISIFTQYEDDNKNYIEKKEVKAIK